jgi:hypothetical protein
MNTAVITPPICSRILDQGITYEQALHIHRLHHESLLAATEIAAVTGHNFRAVSDVLVGRLFPGAARFWEQRA